MSSHFTFDDPADVDTFVLSSMLGETSGQLGVPPGPGITAGANGTRPKRLGHRERQKQQLQQLEQQREQVRQHLEQLTVHNRFLRYRAEVLADLLHTIDDIEPNLKCAAASDADCDTDAELAQVKGFLTLYDQNVTKLGRTLIEAEVDPHNAAKADAVANDVTGLFCFMMDLMPTDPRVLSALLSLHLTEAYKQLKVPEDIHWLHVVESLQLTPEQLDKACITLDLFQPAPDPRHPPTTTTPSHPLSISGDHHTIPPIHPSPVLTLDPPNASAASSSTTHPSHPPLQPPPPGPAPHHISSHPIPTPHATPASEPHPTPPTSVSLPHPHSLQLTSSSDSAPPPPPSAPLHHLPNCQVKQSMLHQIASETSITQEQLDRLEKHFVRINQWASILEAYLYMRLFTPLQSARMFVRSYPLYPNCYSLLTAISAVHHGPKAMPHPPA